MNIGSDEMVTINQLASMIMNIAGKKLTIKHISGPLGVRGRNSDNRLIEKELGWKPSQSLVTGLEITYTWGESGKGYISQQKSTIIMKEPQLAPLES